MTLWDLTVELAEYAALFRSYCAALRLFMD